MRENRIARVKRAEDSKLNLRNLVKSNAEVYLYKVHASIILRGVLRVRV